MDRNKLIDQLTAEAAPVRRPSLSLITLTWLMLSALWVVGITHWIGPIRPTAMEQLSHVGRFQFEIGIGVDATLFAEVRREDE